ncbi:hypothetical protein ACLOJK_001107 [Asimina triloba]
MCVTEDKDGRQRDLELQLCGVTKEVMGDKVIEWTKGKTVTGGATGTTGTRADSSWVTRPTRSSSMGVTTGGTDACGAEVDSSSWVRKVLGTFSIGSSSSSTGGKVCWYAFEDVIARVVFFSFITFKEREGGKD